MLYAPLLDSDGRRLGLIENRDRDLDQGMQQLAQSLRHLDRPLKEICDRILDRLLPSAAQDDVAVLIARTPLPRGSAVSHTELRHMRGPVRKVRGW
ncbi:SpoIIE family protein phosphatase [Streptomyces sp. A3M-1-3]|uniref:SpoIIE family protein phosphatase n=1 Tax=Streptomyces sp. A3M-1-3 TaxID=2962044 RepID=UPI0020B84F6C|nr:SpoIIE family protein phosphatase [Streptomyces sp. A3M-1-3]MCP3819771.1 SpoIIE family protein phosphatase [Streptomyces sp. A3M-1-3]